jgi:hypothetical protein
MPGRVFNPKTPLSTIKAPVTLNDWHKLMRLAIERAETLGYRHVHGLRKALVDGKVERHLRMMGIIHPVDLLRVFPEKG